MLVFSTRHHRPSAAIFGLFDDLLLMKRGGQVVFFGELGAEGVNLIDYFQAIPGTRACPNGYNPATWMLEVIGAGTGGGGGGNRLKDFAQIYDGSRLREQNKASVFAWRLTSKATPSRLSVCRVCARSLL